MSLKQCKLNKQRSIGTNLNLCYLPFLRCSDTFRDTDTKNKAAQTMQQCAFTLLVAMVK